MAAQYQASHKEWTQQVQFVDFIWKYFKGKKNYLAIVCQWEKVYLYIFFYQNHCEGLVIKSAAAN